MFWSWFEITGPSLAYLDPGTGSVLVQAVIGAVAAVLVVVRMYWQKITSLCGMGKTKKEFQERSLRER